MNKGNFQDYLSENHSYRDVFTNGKNLYKNIFSNYRNAYFENKLKQNIYDKLEAGQSVAIIVLNSVSFINPEALAATAQNQTLYEKQPLLFMVFSYLKNKTFLDMSENLTLTRVEQKGSWTLIKFTKLNNKSHD